MGAIPEQAARASRTSSTTTRRAHVRARCGARRFRRSTGCNLTQMFAGDGARRADGAVRHRREPGAVRRRRAPRRGRARRPRSSRRPGHLPHEDRARSRTSCCRRRRRGARARARSPTASAACSACARRSSRPAGAGRLVDHLASSRSGSATTGACRRAEEVWNELRVARAALHGGMSYARLEALGGIQWPCPDESTIPASRSCTAGCGRSPCGGRAGAVPRRASTIRRSSSLTTSIPLRLTTGRRLESYNTGVQTGGYDSPLHRGETLDISPEDAARLGIADGEPVRVISRRGRSTRRRASTRRCAPAWCS